MLRNNNTPDDYALAPLTIPTTAATDNNSSKTINILGIRGIPAAHGGFETFASHLAPYLRDRGWRVNVYCQIEPDAEGNLREDFEDDWEGIHRIHLGSRRSGSAGSMIFDWRCIQDVLKRPGIDLVLGYNTAVLSILQRAFGRKVAMNMDGIEWKRAKWSWPIKAWFYFNEFMGANLCSVPIADHPEIAQHLRRHGCMRAVVIPYGADRIDEAPTEPLSTYGLEPGRYLISIARIEPENSTLEIVRAFSAERRGVKLVVLGKFQSGNRYHDAVRAAASDEVVFPGAIYARDTVSALRYHALAYVHGHQVGGTNPSLVEALGAGSAVIAHDNRFNRWVAGDGQFYFSDERTLSSVLSGVIANPAAALGARALAHQRFEERFRWMTVLGEYEGMLAKLLPIGKTVAAPVPEPLPIAEEDVSNF